MTERLLRHLESRASHRGLVLANEAHLLVELGAEREIVIAELDKLHRAGLIEILAPLPFLVARVRGSWSGSSTPRVQKEQQISSPGPRMQREVPVSSRAAAFKQQEDGGLGEGEALFDRVLRVLGSDADREEFRVILAGHAPALIEQCLTRVQATKSIRVSRAALFRSLLQKLSH